MLERLRPGELSVDYATRARIAAATLRAAIDFLPLGSGLGTFMDVFARYQAGTVSGFVDHAHNDYAEALLELGLPGVVVIALLASPTQCAGECCSRNATRAASGACT